MAHRTSGPRRTKRAEAINRKRLVSDSCLTRDRCTSNNVLTCAFMAKTLLELTGMLSNPDEALRTLFGLVK